MAAASSQPFGNLLASGFQGFTGGLNKDWSSAFKTPLDPIQTLPVKPETTPGAVGGFMSPDFQVAMDAASKIPNETARGMAIASLFGKQMQTQSDNAMLENYPKILDMISERQYQNRLKARPLEFQEMVAKKFLNNLTEIPQNIIAARRITPDMYAPPQAGNVQLVNYGASSPRRIF
jgi:hypothetical protein